MSLSAASLNPAGCNGYPSGNHGFWNADGISGLPDRIMALPDTPPAVPLPAGLPLVLTALGGLVMLRRRIS